MNLAREIETTLSKLTPKDSLFPLLGEGRVRAPRGAHDPINYATLNRKNFYSSSLTWSSMLPIFSMVPCRRSPSRSLLTPAGVPVVMKIAWPKRRATW